MDEQRSARSELATEFGQEFVKVLIKEPVKEAVQEALAEEHSRDNVQQSEPSNSTEEDSDGGGERILKSVLTIVALVGVIFLIRRIRGDSSSEIPGETVGQRGSEHSQSVDTGETS